VFSLISYASSTGTDVFFQLAISYAVEISASWQQCTADMNITCVLEDKIIAGCITLPAAAADSLYSRHPIIQL
jgi:hypothetical protein